jgi:hypothetical protein
MNKCYAQNTALLTLALLGGCSDTPVLLDQEKDFFGYKSTALFRMDSDYPEMGGARTGRNSIPHYTGFVSPAGLLPPEIAGKIARNRDRRGVSNTVAPTRKWSLPLPR